MRMNGKTVLITGGNSGIGFAAAKRLIEEGARVAITGRNTQKLARAAAELGPMASAHRVDASAFSTLDAELTKIAGALGKLDAVFLNAGTAGLTPLGATTEELYDDILNTNLKSVFFHVQSLLPHLNDRASIVLNSSIAKAIGAPGMGAYAASKAGLVSLAQCFAAELSGRGIRINVVSTGNIRTEFWGHVADDDHIAAVHAFVEQSIPLARLGEAVEIANAVLFLCSDESSYIQGADLYVDGGVVGSPMGAPIYRFPTG